VVTMRKAGLLRCFGGADSVAFGAAPCFGFSGMSVAAFGRLASGVGTGVGKGGHSAGHHPVARAGSSWLATGGHHADAKAASGWFGQLIDSTWGRRPVIWFSTCCCAPAKYLPASSNDGFRLMVRRDVASVRLFTRNIGADGSR